MTMSEPVRAKRLKSASNGQAEEQFPFGHNAPPGPEPVQAKTAPEPSADTPEAPEALNPFDPKTYARGLKLDAAAGVRRVLTELSVRAPDRSWWARCHPTHWFQARVIELKDEGETYLVLPHLNHLLVGEPCWKLKSFHLAVNMQGKAFLWAVRRPEDDKDPDKWMRAPLEAVRLAVKQWVRIAWNDMTRQHDVNTCESDAEPEWPDLDMESLNRLAFKGFIMDKSDHPVLRRLKGQSR
jgi:hypothetical protein